MPKTPAATKTAPALPKHHVDFRTLLSGLASREEKAVINEGFPEDNELFEIDNPKEAIARVAKFGEMFYLKVIDEMLPRTQPDPGAPYIKTGITMARMAYLTAASTYLRLVARAEAVSAITAGRLSRIAAAKILRVHQTTVAQWVKQAERLQLE
jgi:hypothetical protein